MSLFSFSSNNRITTQGALCIAKGLEGNNTLEVLKVIILSHFFIVANEG